MKTTFDKTDEIILRNQILLSEIKATQELASESCDKIIESMKKRIDETNEMFNRIKNL